MNIDKHLTKKARLQLAQDVEEHLTVAFSELPRLRAMVQVVLDGATGLAIDAESRIDDLRALPPSLEDEVGRAAVWLLCAGKEAFEQHIAILTDASASGPLLADALERFLFASVRLHGADVRELTARLSSCGGGSDEGPWDSALIYAITPEAKLRCWVRRVLNAGWADAILECGRLLRPPYGSDGVMGDSAACEVVRDVKACLERLSRHQKPVPPILLPYDTPDLLIEPLELCNLGLGSVYGGASPAAAVSVEAAGFRQANGAYFLEPRVAGHADATTFVHRSRGFKLTLETRTGCSRGHPPYMRWDLCQAPSAHVLYTARAHSVSNHIPPATGWRVGPRGRLPCPRLRIARLEERTDIIAAAGPGEVQLCRGASPWPTAAGTVSAPHTIPSRTTCVAPCWTPDSPSCTGHNPPTPCLSSIRVETRRRCKMAAIDVAMNGADEGLRVGDYLSWGKAFESSLCERLRPGTDDKLPSPQHTSSTSPRAIEQHPSFASEIRCFEDHLGDGRSQRLQQLHAETCALLKGEELLLEAKLQVLVCDRESDGCGFSTAAAYVRQVQRDIAMEAGHEAADSHIQQPQQCADVSASLNQLVERLSQERRQRKQRDRVAGFEMRKENEDRLIDSCTADSNEKDGPMANVEGKPQDVVAFLTSQPAEDVVLATKLEVVDVEVERTASSATPALLYLIRVTISEVDSDAAACPASLSPRSTRAWSLPPPLRHRARTFRKRLSSIMALYSDLQALLLTAAHASSAAKRQPCVNSRGNVWSSATLPPVLDAQELRAFEGAYVKRHLDPLPSFSLTHTSELRSSARRAVSAVERYLVGVISLHKNLSCAGGGTPAESKRPMEELAEGVWSALQRFTYSSDGSVAVDDIVLSWSMEQPPSTQAVDVWSREEVLKKQRGKCRACAVPLAASFLGMDTQYMLCRYTGAVYCTQRCGGEDKAVLPCDVATRWDFTRKTVCKLAAAYLREMADRPVVRLTAMEAGATAQGDVLKHVGSLRDQLMDFKRAVHKAGCRQGQGLLQAVENSRPHLVHERDLFSMTDLMELKDRQLTEGLAELVEALHEHVVEECALCKTKGCSTCGVCRHTEPLFPHQSWKVSLCDACGATFHKACVRDMQMPLQCPFCHGLGPTTDTDDRSGNVKLREVDEGRGMEGGIHNEGTVSRVKAHSRDVVMRGTFEAVAAAAAACPAPPRVRLKNNLEAGPALNDNNVRSTLAQRPPIIKETISITPQGDERPLGASEADTVDSVRGSNAAEDVTYNNVPVSTEDLEFSFT